MSRAPSRGIIRGSGQGTTDRDREVSVRAIRVQTAIRANRGRMGSSFTRASRAKGGTVTATRAGDSRDREEGTSQGSALFVARLAISDRIVLIGAGPHSSSSRVLARSHRDLCFPPLFPHRHRWQHCHPF